MAQYIDKNTLIEKLEKEIKCIYAGREYVGISFSEENIVRGIQIAEDIVNTLKVKEVDLEKERMSECPYRQVVCTMYEGKMLECKGACSWVVDYPKLKELKAQKGENI